MAPVAFANELRRIAGYVNPATLRSHPRKPKPKRGKGYVARSQVQRHVATARVLTDRDVR